MKNFILLSIIILIGSCKKNYSCKCINPGGSYEAFKKKDTYKNAKNKCEDYYKTNYSGIPFNETNCEIK